MGAYVLVAHSRIVGQRHSYRGRLTRVLMALLEHLAHGGHVASASSPIFLPATMTSCSKITGHDVLRSPAPLNGHPADAPSTDLLELAAAFLKLTVKVAKQQGRELDFRGLRVLDKCVAIAVVPSDLLVAQQAAGTSLAMIEGTQRWPTVGAKPVQRVRRARSSLPGKVLIRAGSWKEAMTPLAAQQVQHTSLETMRVIPVRAGGKRPALRFKSVLDQEDFTLRASEELARAVGALLYRHIDIDAEVVRNGAGEIDSGKLLAYYELASDDAAVWRTWFSDHASSWDEVEDIEAELEDG